MELKDFSGKPVGIVVPLRGAISYAYFGLLDHTTYPEKPGKPDDFSVSLDNGCIKFCESDIETIEEPPEGMENLVKIIRLKGT